MWLFAVSILLVTCSMANAQCKDSAVNCTGNCGQYIDDNKDYFCDESIIDTSLFPIKPATVVSIQEVLDTIAKKEEKILPAGSTSFENPKQDLKRLPEKKQNANESQPQPGSIQFFTPPITVGNGTRQHMKGKKNNYHFLSIAVPLIITYFLLLWLSSIKKIKKITMLRIWNILLLVSFLVTAILGLLITAKIIYNLQLPYMKMIYIIHVDFGVAMAIISIFHLLRHWNYYKTILSRR